MNTTLRRPRYPMCRTRIDLIDWAIAVLCAVGAMLAVAFLIACVSVDHDDQHMPTVMLDQRHR